jgi:hypothetical protein
MHDATPEELAIKNVPFDRGASAAILEWEHYQDDTNGYAKEYVRIKIFTAEGLKYGDVNLPFQPGFSHIRSLEARTIHADGTVVPFKGETFDKVLMKSSRGSAMATTFSLPDVQPGSIIEYRYILAWPHDRFPDRSFWEMQREVPIVKERLWFRPHTDFYQSFFRYQGISKQMKSVALHFEMELDNIPAFQREPFSPPDDHVIGRVNFRYTDPYVDIQNYWVDTGKSLLRDSEKFIATRPAATVTQIIQGATTDEEKLRKIYANVQELKSSHDEINRTFVAFARAAGFTAWLVRAVDREDIVFSDAPDATQLTADLAVVKAGEKERYFDPGTQFTPFGQLRWNLAGSIALRFPPKTTATLIQTPLPTFSDAQIHRTADLHFDGNVIKGTIMVSWDGQSALVRRLEMADGPEGEGRLAIEKEVKDWLPEGSVVKLKEAGPFKSAVAPLEATLDVEMPAAASFTGSRALMPMAIFSSSRTPFAAEERQNIIDFQYPRTISDEVTLHLSDGSSIESVPENVTNDRHTFVYKAEWLANGSSTLTFKRTFIINAVQLPKTLYGQVRDFWAKALTADQVPVVLKR